MKKLHHSEPAANLDLQVSRSRGASVN